MNDVVGGQVYKEITPSHPLDRDSFDVSLNGSWPDCLLVVQVPDLGGEVQGQRAVRIEVYGIAINLSAVVEFSEDSLDDWKILVVNEQVHIHHRSQSEHSIEPGDEVGALEQDTFDALLVKACEDDL